MAALLLHVRPQPLLHAMMMKRITHDGRSRMEFHGDALDGHHHVVEALFLHLAHVIGKSLGKLANLLPAGIHPDIDITRRTSGRIGTRKACKLHLCRLHASSFI